MSISPQTKLALGSTLSTVAALGIVLTLLLGWTSVPNPWDYLLAFANGVLAGLGATLAVSGLIDRRPGH